MKKRMSVKLSAILLAAAVFLSLIPLGIFTVSAETVIETANITVNTPLAGTNPDFAPVSDDEEKYYATVSSWYEYEAPYPQLDDDSVFESGKSYALRVSFEAEDGYEFTEETAFTINGESTSCYGSKNDREYIFTVPQTVFDVSTPQELADALNKQTPVEAINIVDDFTVNSDCLIYYDPAHIDNYSDTVVTVNEGVTLTVGENGLLGSFWPSYEGDWENGPVPNGRFINNGVIIVKSGGAIVADFDTNNGEVTVEDGGECVCANENNGEVYVQSGGIYQTSQGREVRNHGTISVAQDARMEARFGSTIINEDDGTINLDGEFLCGCVGFDGDVMWFINHGSVYGGGSVILTEADSNIAPVSDMDALIEELMTQLGQETRFENWDDINIFKRIEVSSYEELAALLPGNRIVAGEEVAGDMDIIAVVTGDITIPEDTEFDTMARIEVAQDVNVTVSGGAQVTCGMENCGSVTVCAGGKLGTTMGGDIRNCGELFVEEGGEIVSQMGGRVVNGGGGTFGVDGEFLCGCIGFDGNDGFWFENAGEVTGGGFITLYEVDPENMPVTDMAALAESAQSIVGTGDNKPEVRVKQAVEEEVKLPFELVAPAHVYAERLEESPTSNLFVYSLSNDMTTFFKNMNEAHLHETIEQFMSEYDFDEVWMNIQIDWALDDVNDPVSGWHYSRYWDGDPTYGLGRDAEGHYCYSEWDIVDGNIGNAEETINDIWVTRGVPNDERWYGNPGEMIPGVKDQLNEGQYTYDEEANDGDGELIIDFTEHTMYFRARFVVTTRTGGVEDKFYFSDWSEVTCVGKDAVAAEPLTAEDLTAPVITGLRMTDKEFNDNPIVAFTLTVPETLAENAAKVTAAGGQIVIEVEARVQGDENFVGLQGDWIIRGGEMESALFSLVNDERPNIPKDTIVELRCRYCYDHPRFFDGSIYSDYSKIISFGTDDITHYQGDPADERVKAEITVTRPVHSRTLGASTASAGEGYGIAFSTYLADGETPLGADTVFAAGNYYDYEFTVTPLTQEARDALARTDLTVNDEKADSVTVNKNDGTLTVRKRFYCPKGDVNADGLLNNKDLTRLFQYLSDWDVQVNEAALDINGDGSINNKDLTRLFQYLSDWDVQIF